MEIFIQEQEGMRNFPSAQKSSFGQECSKTKGGVLYIICIPDLLLFHSHWKIPLLNMENQWSAAPPASLWTKRCHLLEPQTNKEEMQLKDSKTRRTTPLLSLCFPFRLSPNFWVFIFYLISSKKTEIIGWNTVPATWGMVCRLTA